MGQLERILSLVTTHEERLHEHDTRALSVDARLSRVERALFEEAIAASRSTASAEVPAAPSPHHNEELRRMQRALDGVGENLAALMRENEAARHRQEAQLARHEDALVALGRAIRKVRASQKDVCRVTKGQGEWVRSELGAIRDGDLAPLRALEARQDRLERDAVATAPDPSVASSIAALRTEHERLRSQLYHHEGASSSVGQLMATLSNQVVELKGEIAAWEGRVAQQESEQEIKNARRSDVAALEAKVRALESALNARAQDIAGLAKGVHRFIRAQAADGKENGPPGFAMGSDGLSGSSALYSSWRAGLLARKGSGGDQGSRALEAFDDFMSEFKMRLGGVGPGGGLKRWVQD